MARLEMTVNGRAVALEVDGLRPLVDVLRNELGLKGTKIGCREGECGACTVLLDGEAINACLIPAMKAQGRSVLTIEGIGTTERPHPVQKSIAEAGGVQCGYCTPGFVMSAVALLGRNPHPTVNEVQEAIGGNLCRCTGYKRLVHGVLDAAEVLAAERATRDQ